MKFFIVVGSAITRLVSVRGGPNMVLNLVLVVMCKYASITSIVISQMILWPECRIAVSAVCNSLTRLAWLNKATTSSISLKSCKNPCHYVAILVDIKQWLWWSH